nr:MAG TPA: hypothetical protein [Caudoviricetes sp.]
MLRFQCTDIGISIAKCIVRIQIEQTGIRTITSVTA